jgi:uncharacterized membrane protein YciS (DUF1049 family)
MNKLITLLSLFLFVIAPTISAQNNDKLTFTTASSHTSEYCSDVMSCTESAHQCCVIHTLVSSYFEEVSNITAVGVSHRTAYLQHEQPILLGVQSVFYRPPIL